jgi:uncharacterized protein (DUF427 family)
MHPQPEPTGPGEESVWDYPRPPALERTARRVRVELAGVTLAESSAARRVLETSHPPTYYLPPEDVEWDRLSPAAGTSFCEWKGTASYWTATAGGEVVEGRCWSYPSPSASFRELTGHVSFYPSEFDCYVDGERVRAQPGNFYGGWVTSEIKGPFKGAPGSMGW